MAKDFTRKEVKPVKNTGACIFSDFSSGLYLLDTPRGMGSQLASLAMLGGRNVWSENGALVPQYGYMLKGELPQDERVAGISKDSKSSASFFIVTRLGNVYLYNASQGLKKYKTTIGEVAGDMIIARGNNTMIYYADGAAIMFGSYYENSDIVDIDKNITVADYSTYFEFTIPKASQEYYWNGKEICVDSKTRMTITAMTPSKVDGSVAVRAVIGTDIERPIFDKPVAISEKAKIPIDLLYTPEAKETLPIKITPTLMEVANNRLCIVDVSGNIFYSAIGVYDDLQQAHGAGYFGGFYNDTSNCLALDDYMDGVLITKQNGLYYMKITDLVNVQSTVGDNKSGLSITKISEIGQEYATDHIIVREKVYAYDSNSCSLVLAAEQNVFGQVTAGKTIIPSDFLNAQHLGITENKRILTYNNEAACFILYHGENLNNGLILTLNGSLFPRELDKQFEHFMVFNQGIVGITSTGKIVQEFKKGTIILNKTPIVEFEAIGLKDNRCICASLLEVTELNGVEYNITISNAGSSYQHINPHINYGIDKVELPPLIYSDKRNNITNDSFELTSKWAGKKSNLTRLYAPMSGRDGIYIIMEFAANQEFCLAALRIPDFSQGE